MVQKTYYKTKDYCKVKFTFESPEAETVAIAGLNEDWESPIALEKKKNGIFSIDVALPLQTQHQFKYVVNKVEWLNDGAADGEYPNVYGGTNSVVNV